MTDDKKTTGYETDATGDESFAWTEPEAKGSDAGAKAREWLTQLQTIIDNLATQAGPVVKEVGAKAAELAALAGEKAGPVAQKAAELTGQAGQKLAVKSPRPRRPSCAATSPGRRRPPRPRRTSRMPRRTSLPTSHDDRRRLTLTIARRARHRRALRAPAATLGSRTGPTRRLDLILGAMSVRPIVLLGDPRLRLKGEPVSSFGKFLGAPARRPDPHDARRPGRRSRRAPDRRGAVGLRGRGRGPAARAGEPEDRPDPRARTATSRAASRSRATRPT